MGVDCKIYLPSNVRVSDVAKVIGAVCGAKIERTDLEYGKSAYYFVRVPQVVVESTTMAELALINMPFKTVDGIDNHYVMYHFEPGSGHGRLLMPRSTAFWIAVGRRLIDFFGGYMINQDCSDSETDYDQPVKSHEENQPEDGHPWQKFQQRILDLKPISEKEWRSCDKLAAYKIGE